MLRYFPWGGTGIQSNPIHFLVMRETFPKPSSDHVSNLLARSRKELATKEALKSQGYAILQYATLMYCTDGNVSLKK